MTRYLSLKIENIEPIRISDDSTSQRGQTDTLSYIPGSVLRGIALHGIQDRKDFSTWKRLLLSDEVRFLNAYPMIYHEDEECPLLPAMKGFQEQKAEAGENLQKAKKKKIVSEIFDEKNLEEGMKRAYLGTYCYPEKDTVYYMSPAYGADLNVNTKKKQDNLFRSQYLQKGQTFQGWIATEKEEALEALKEIFGQKGKGEVRIGNRCTSGYGTCKIRVDKVTESLPYGIYSEQGDILESCYVMLLSDTAMRGEAGELKGLDLVYLEELMEVEKLEISQAAASTVEICGFNRTWNCKVPSVKMYEKGSIFRFTYQGTLKAETIQKIQHVGIGIRRNEGFGRALFLKDCRQLQYKCDLEGQQDIRRVRMQEDVRVAYENLTGSEKKTLDTIARGYYEGILDTAITRYIVNQPLPTGNLSKSQIGAIHSIALQFRNEPERAEEKLNDYFRKAIQRDEHRKQHQEKGKNQVRSTGIALFVEKLMAQELECTLGLEIPENIMGRTTAQLLSEEEKQRKKIQLLLDMIRYKNKEGKGNG